LPMRRRHRMMVPAIAMMVPNGTPEGTASWRAKRAE
jgi:hypothetical protein